MNNNNKTKQKRGLSKVMLNCITESRALFKVQLKIDTTVG